MHKLLWVGLGGFTGAVLRYVTNGLVEKWTAGSAFPLGTMAVNLMGCAAIGLLSYVGDTRDIFSAELRLLIFMGFLGAFTTFSTFSNQTVCLMQDAQGSMAILNVGLHLVAGLTAVWVGRGIANLIWK